MDSAKVVLVTNVGHGFGRAAALAFGRAGHNVVCSDRDVEQASKTAAEIEEAGGQAIPVQSDMTMQLDVQNTFQKVFEIFGTLDGIVHVAAHESSTAFRELADNEFAELFDENLRSTYLMLRLAARVAGDGLWTVLVGPPRNAVEPQMASVRGALSALGEAVNRRFSRLTCNMVTPSRTASDPRHDDSLVQAVLFLAAQSEHGVGGQNLQVELPPPPRITESLLPEVRAALDASVRQDDLEASLYDDDFADEPAEDFADASEDDFDGEDDLDDDDLDELEGIALESAGFDGTEGEGIDYRDFDDYPDPWEAAPLFAPRRDPLG